MPDVKIPVPLEELARMGVRIDFNHLTDGLVVSTHEKSATIAPKPNRGFEGITLIFDGFAIEKPIVSTLYDGFAVITAKGGAKYEIRLKPLEFHQGEEIAKKDYMEYLSQFGLLEFSEIQQH